MSDQQPEVWDRHQLRNKINNITMNAELVKLQIQQAIPEDQVIASIERMLTECKDCASYLNEHIDG
ncbi:MAG: histidine kinase [Pseudomonadota bacterium]|nr:histidine kinase [Pseudomonadales bacterium]MDY6919237.1 histidine kinase [Pseudomonadota bacterium]